MTSGRKGYLSVLILIVLWGIPGLLSAEMKMKTTVAEIALYQGADRQQILEEGAKKEGKIIIYTDHILNQNIRPLVSAFQKKYPHIKVDIWRAGDNVLIPRIFEEHKAGRHVVSVLAMAQKYSLVLREREILQPFYSPNMDYIEDGAITKAPGGGAFAVGHYESHISLGYNTNLITKDQVPKTYQELLDPKWKGKVAIAGSSTGTSWMGSVLENHGEGLLTRLAQQNFDVHAVSGRAILDMIVSGEYVLSPTVFDSHMRFSKAKGAPAGWVPLEPVSTDIGQIMLPKNAQNPHAAMLLIDFDLTRQAGEIYKAGGYVSPRKDISSGETTYKKDYGPSSTEQYVKWQRLFDKLFLKKK
ncbi:ABC transporter substrate-binding protein [Thermodesulfobacteriota bacterium]